MTLRLFCNTVWWRVGSNDQQLGLSSGCAVTLHSTTPFSLKIVSSLSQQYLHHLQWPTTPFILKQPWYSVTLAHLRVIFTAFFVPWLDGWQGHSGWIVKWPPKKALNSLRLPGIVPSHLISWFMVDKRLWRWYHGNMQQFPFLFASKLSFPRKMIISAHSWRDLAEPTNPWYPI